MTKIFGIALSTLQTSAIIAVSAFSVAGFYAAPSNAAGSPSTSSPPPKCKAGFVYVKKKKKCVKKTSELLSDEDLYLTARAYIEDKKFEQALDLLQRIKNQNQPRVLNYIGFSTRKLGNVDKGIVFYKKALLLNPDYNVAREYLGEGYLQKGDLKSAKLQLSEILRRCGTGCEAYLDLSEEIEKYLADNKSKSL